MANSEFVVDVARWNMGDYADFFDAATNSQFQSMFNLVAKVVTEWPYEGNPSDPSSYRNLSVTEWRTCVSAVTAAINGQFQQGN